MIEAAGLDGKPHHSVFHRVFASTRWPLDQLGLAVEMLNQQGRRVTVDLYVRKTRLRTVDRVACVLKVPSGDLRVVTSELPTTDATAKPSTAHARRLNALSQGAAAVRLDCLLVRDQRASTIPAPRAFRNYSPPCTANLSSSTFHNCRSQRRSRRNSNRPSRHSHCSTSEIAKREVSDRTDTKNADGL